MLAQGLASLQQGHRDHLLQGRVREDVKVLGVEERRFLVNLGPGQLMSCKFCGGVWCHTRCTLILHLERLAHQSRLAL